MKSFLIIVLSLLGGVAYSQDGPDIRSRLDYLYGEHEIYATFFNELISAVLRGDVKTVASLNEYPLKVVGNAGTEIIENEADFISQYNNIVNDNIRNEVKRQSFDDLFANYEGMMIGRGQIWFTGICTGKDPDNACDIVDVKVVTYNKSAPASD